MVEVQGRDAGPPRCRAAESSPWRPTSFAPSCNICRSRRGRHITLTSSMQDRARRSNRLPSSSRRSSPLRPVRRGDAQTGCWAQYPSRATSTRTFTSTGTCAQAALHSPPADARGTTTRNRSKTSSAWRPQNGRKGRPQNGSKGRYICPSFRFVAAHFLPCAFCMGRFIRQEICARRRLPWVATRARHRREAWFCQTSGMECPGYPVWVRATQGRVTVPLMNQCATKQRRRIYER